MLHLQLLCYHIYKYPWNSFDTSFGSSVQKYLLFVFVSLDAHTCVVWLKCVRGTTEKDSAFVLYLSLSLLHISKTLGIKLGSLAAIW